MKILYIIPRFHPFKGGAEQNIEAMATRMVEQGHEVSIFTTNVKFRNEKLPWVEEYKGIKIYRHWAINESLYAGFYPRLLPRLLASDADIIHVSGFGFIWTEFCLVMKRLISRKVKFINTPHGPFLAFAKKGIKGFVKKFYTFFLKLIIPFVYDRAISVVPTQKDWMMKEYNVKERNIILIPNGINKNYIEKKVPKYNPEDKIIITYLNRMEWYKGIQDVLYAMSKLKKEVLDKIEFWIMGREGRYTKKLRQIISENNLENNTKIIFTPTDEQRDEAFLKSQVNILPSKWEATGIVLIEAMAKGNLIITTNQNEASELLINPLSGYSYTFGDVERLTYILNDVVNNYKKRFEMIEHNLSFARNFTWEAVFPTYLELIDSLLNENS